MTPPPPTNRKVGHYTLLKEIGRGAQGQVFLAEDVRLSRKVALKILSSSFTPSPASLRRFQREAEAASRLDHPGICSVFEAGEAQGVQYIAMRFIEGETLARQIQLTRAPAPLAGSETVVVAEPVEGPRSSEPSRERGGKAPGSGGTPSSRISREEIIRIVHLVERTARAVHAAHEAGLIHRDIKPGNIMVTKDGEPVILDFGLARDEESEVQTLTHSGDLLGTPAYMSPEQLLAQRIQLDRRTDVYSLGVTLFECLTLERPFDAPTREGLYQKILTAPVPDATRINRLIPRDLKVVIETAMERDRERRYKTAFDLAEDLRRVRSYEPIQARPASAALRFRRWTQRNPVLATSTLGLFLFLATGLGISLFLLQKLDRERQQTLIEAGKKDVALHEKAEALKAVQLESDAKAAALLQRQEALERAEGLRLTAQASNAVDQNPGLALLLSLEAAKRGAGPVLNGTIVEALREHREERVFQSPSGGGAFSFFSPDGSRLLMTAWNGSSASRIWDTSTGRLLAVLRGTTDSASIAAFSPDASLLITTGDFGPETRVWSAVTGEQLCTLVGHRYPVSAVAFRADGERAVTASQDGSARIWDVRTGKSIATLRGSECGLGSAEFSPDGELVLTASSGLTYNIVYDAAGNTRQQIASTYSGATTARLWNASTGEPVQVLRGHAGKVVASFSPDGRMLVTTSMYAGAAAVRIWDVTTGQKIRSLDVPGGVNSLARFDPSSTRLLTVNNLGAFQPSHSEAGELTMSPRYVARIWDVATGSQICVIEGHSNTIASACFSPDGERILTASEDSTARVWKTMTGQVLATLKGHEAALLTAAFSPDGLKIYTTSQDRTARVWNADTTRELSVVPSEEARASRFTIFSADGKKVFIAHARGGSIWDVGSSAKLGEIGRATTADAGWLPKLWQGGKPGGTVFEQAAFNADGTLLMTRSARQIDVWGGEAWRHVSAWKARTGSPVIFANCFAFTPDGSAILSSQLRQDPSSVIPALLGSTAKGERPVIPVDLILWNAANGSVIRTLEGHTEPVTSASFSADGRRAVTRSEDSIAYVWDLTTGKLLARSDLALGGLSRAVISPDGARIAVTTWSLEARVLDAATCAQVATFSGHSSNLLSIGFSPDGQRVLTSSADHTARIWDAGNGEQLAILEGHRAPLVGASYSPSGKQVVTFAEDQTVRIWDAANGKELIIFPQPDGVLWASLTRDDASLMAISTRSVPRIWPLDLVEEARRRKARDLTPRERDRYEIGMPGERLAARREAELKDLLNEVEVSIAAGSLDDGALRGQGVQSTLLRLEQLVGPRSTKEEIARVETALRSILERVHRNNPQLLGTIAQMQLLDGRPRDSVLTLEEAVLLPEAPATLLSALETRRASLLPDLVSYASIDAALDGREALVPEGASWRFFRGKSEPSPGLEWTEAAFDEAAWEEGASGFGYGDNDDATVLADMYQSYTTVYLRRRIPLETADAYRKLTLSVLADDGFVAYLNGKEVARSLAGEVGARIAHDGVADKEAPEPLTPITIELDPGLLRPGPNVLAVQGINRSRRSTDLSLLPVLRGERVTSSESIAKRFESFRAQSAGGDGPHRVAYLEARILQLAGRSSEAADAFSRLHALDRTRPEPALRLAECQRAAGKPREAVATLEKTLSSGAPLPGEAWQLWLQLKTADMKVPAGQLLAEWTRGVESSGGAVTQEPGKDFKWVLEQLAASNAIRIHCGGGSVTSSGGAIWGRDRFYSGGTSLHVPGLRQGEISGGEPIYGTARRFFQGYGFAGYRVPLPPGLYNVTLHLADLPSRGSRAPGSLPLPRGRIDGEARDPSSSAPQKPATLRAYDIRVEGGLLEIELDREKVPSGISGIEIRRA